MQKKVIIVGAGLCGSLLALRMAQRGYTVTVYERRSDMRKKSMSAGRSINLALSNRGLRSLAEAGVEQDVLPLLIPMHGRMLHPLDAPLSLVSYSGRQNEYINSVSRGGLNKILLEKAEATGKVAFHFDVSCTEADIETGIIQLKNLKTGEQFNDSAEVVFGTDGANSSIRNAFLKESARYRFDFSIQYLRTGYKELEIPAGDNGSYRIEKNALHIWPRKGFMLIALPNLDGSFTVTLFLAMDGEGESFANLNTDEEIYAFFEKYFPTALAHMPDIVEDFRQNPTSSLGTVKCYPWQMNGKYLLMGDAAHAVVPFYGQGMNASFEDVRVLNELMDQYGDDWNTTLQQYQEVRKQDGDAIGDLAVENEIEMRAATADPTFLLKRKIELALEQTYPNYYSKYSLVTFNDNVPYSQAMQQGRAQDALLMDYARNVGNWESVSLSDVVLILREAGYFSGGQLFLNT